MELPADLRYIPLKYDGRCRSCKRTVRAGEKANWSPSTKKVWCSDCTLVESKLRTPSKRVKDDTQLYTASSSPNSTRNRESERVDTNQAQWRKMCVYAQRCIEAEAAKSLVPYVKKNAQWFVHPGKENLVVGQDDSSPAPDELSKRLSRSRQWHDRSFIYGWPTVVVIDRDNAPKIAPLFVVHVEPEEDQKDRWKLHATVEPEFNLAITTCGIFDPSVSEDVHDLLKGGLPFGDSEAFSNLANQTASILGLTIRSTPDPEFLDRQLSRKPGIYNTAVSVLVEATGEYQATLREELQQLQSRDDWPKTAAAHLLPNGFASMVHKRPPTGPLAAPLLCNQSQEETLELVRKSPLTVVTGPPGTGKTQLVVNAVTNAWMDGGNILVTSTNNAAVDVAVDRAERDVCSGLLLRTGNRAARDQISYRVAAALSDADVHRGNQSTARSKLTRVADERARILENLSRIDELDDELLQISEEWDELKPVLIDATRSVWDLEVSPDLSISSFDLEQRAIRITRAWLFRGYRTRRLCRRVMCSETTPLESLINWAQCDQSERRLSSRLKAKRAEREKLMSAVGDPSTCVREANRKWSEASLDAIRSDVAARIKAGANNLQALGSAPANVERFRKAIVNSFTHLRGWACTSLSAHNNFNLESGLFDLVIVDEASQCSLAAVLPLAYRAKRLTLVGDPNQLNPIVSLSDGLLQGIAEQSGFDNSELRERGIHHKDGSAYQAFEFARRPEKPVLLNEHFRCHPHIARWFNRTFYQGNLTVLTDVSDSDNRDRYISWYDVAGVAERPHTGSWINQAEAEQVIRHLLLVLKSGYKNVGVVAPFVAQSQLIARLARNHLGQDKLDDISFVSGTAHRLQGDERDVVILSSVISPEMSESGVRWVEKERNLLNVAVSRARQALIVIGHPSVRELGSPTLSSLRVYLGELVNQNKTEAEIVADFRTDSRSEELLLSAMQLRNLSPYSKLNVEGYELDFALMEQGIKLNLEVDGDQHLDIRGRQRRQDVTRDRVLSNLGWTVHRIAAWRCFEEIDEVIKEIITIRDRLCGSLISC